MGADRTDAQHRNVEHRDGKHSGDLDPAALQVLIARLGGIAEEMGAVLQRSAFSPNIKERADCSAAVFDPEGRLLAQAEHIPVHLGSMPASVRAVIDHLGDRLGPGDQAIVNDPFAGGTHLNDITLVAPCFGGSGADGGGPLVGWVANRAHHADVGGSAPGSIPADAEDIHAEGLRIPPVLLTDDLRALLAANSRTPVERSGDLGAQLGANVVGVERLAELAGSDFSAVLDHGERRSRAVLGALPESTVSASDVLDSTGSSSEQQRPATIRLAVTVRHGDEPPEAAGPARQAGSAASQVRGGGPRITFDFTGTDPQRWGNTNAVRAVTVSAVAFSLRAVLDPTLPANDGVMRPVRIITPGGSIVDATPPVAVGAGNVEVSQRVADVCQLALAGLVPDRVPAASQGTMNNLLIGGDGPDGPWVYYETTAGGQGGRPPRPGTAAAPVPGMSGVHTAMTNTRNTPIEALERSYPMRVRAQRLRRGSGGAGAAPGGDGIEREIELLVDATASLITERRVSQPWGLAGGQPGAVGENWLLPQGDEGQAERLADKCTVRLRAGDVLRVLTPGGGGWGADASARRYPPSTC
jgi:N-methylhydantoinase B/oxoprolinase/acetone carboxylase alpha subunit